MLDTKGKCKHGEFLLRDGCKLCMAEQRAAAGDVPASFGGKTDDAPSSIGGTAAEPEFEYTEHEGETAVALRPGEDVEAHGYFEQAKKLLWYAELKVVATVEDVKDVNDDLSLISKLKKVMENKRKSLLDPLKLQADAIRETYTFLMAPVLKAGKIYREKMLAYNAEQERMRLQQEDINRKRLEAAQQEMDLKGELSEPVNLVEVAPEASKKVSTELGASGQRDNWKWAVTDFALVPDEYKVVDGSMLTAVAKKHHDQKQVPGVRFYNEPIISVRAR